LFGLVALMTQYDSLIFSAAGAFVSLPRPGREDAERLDALAIPLFEKLSVEGKRRIAAVLSECRSIIPEQLVEALILQPLDISASLLISRAEIPDHILEKAMSIGGEPHARIIALKHNISISVKTRIDAFIESIIPMTEVKATQSTKNKSSAQTELEVAQDRLRNMMMRKTLPDLKHQASLALTAFKKGDEPNIVAKLINLALQGDADFLSTALADEWSAPFSALRPLVQRNSLHTLSALIKGLGFGATDTFAVVSAFNPSAFASREAIASFYLKFQAIDDGEIDSLKQGFVQNAAAAGKAA
jgi:uncharacterized protein (DUF2336 family)